MHLLFTRGLSGCQTEKRNVITQKAIDSAAIQSSSSDETISSFDEIDGKPIYNAIMTGLLKLKPSKIVLQDDSDQHAGHAGSKGWEESGESHFSLEIVSSAFSGLSLVKRHQLIYLLLGDVMDKIHALSISAKTPDEP